MSASAFEEFFHDARDSEWDDVVLFLAEMGLDANEVLAEAAENIARHGARS